MSRAKPAAVEAIPAKIRETIVDVLGVDEAIVTRDALLVEDLGADSLDLVELTMELERAYGRGPISQEQEDRISDSGRVAVLIGIFEGNKS